MVRRIRSLAKHGPHDTADLERLVVLRLHESHTAFELGPYLGSGSLLDREH